ncbi:nicotinamide riboside transporter PnuC [Caldimonas sp. KR1-144]|uniref:nicotinamide riboside transporter PnuC n=1 Tax=Caldimonas sp. KR1-144 TaxID=3400911 RepID=UPI003BFB2091
MLDTLLAWLNAPAGSLGSRAELIGSLLGVWMVVCNIRVNPLAWPLAITSSALYGLVFHAAGLHGNAWLQGLFIVVACWGWWEWLKGRESDGRALAVRTLSARGRVVVVAAWLALTPAIVWLLHEHATPAAWADGFVSAGSVVAQFLLARKRVENWVVWTAVNAVGVVLFAQQGLMMTTGLYLLFLVMALLGWRAWAQRARTPQTAVAHA